MTTPINEPSSSEKFSVGAIVPLPKARCTRRSGKAAQAIFKPERRWIGFPDLYLEPFRLFFPAATLAGLIGVALWPIMLLGWTANYPGPSHARLMVQGFFGGFIFGFLGTSMPRFVEARPLSAREALLLLALFLGNVAANAAGMTTFADTLFAGEILLWFSMLKGRCLRGTSRPPPSFVLVGLSFVSVLGGTVLNLVGTRWELSESLELLARSLSYHAFVLLCILGAGGFLLPRFLGLGVRRTFPESASASPEWKRAALIAAMVGMVILATYALEAFGHPRIAGTLRTAAIISYLWYELPMERLQWHRRGVQWQLITGLVCIPLGVLAAGWFNAMRVSFVHLELIGGFALITTGIAARVVFGHSGVRERLERFDPWLTAAALLMLLGLFSRVSGDFLPRLQTSHYFYGALCWLIGAVVWSARVLPRIVRPDPET